MTENIDFTYLKTVSGGDEAFELHMIETLIVEIDQKMTEMQGSISGRDTDGIRLQAHSLKNLYGVLGVGSLKEQFFVFEKAHATMPGDILEQQFFQCEKEWQLNKTALDNVVAAYKSRL